MTLALVREEITCPDAVSSDHCERHIRASAIAAWVATKRGYRTVTRDDDALLKQLGFSDEQRFHVPALLIPLYDVHGDLVKHELRPDVPRIIDGKEAKYDGPPGKPAVLDVHPSARVSWDKVAHTILITEGTKKADAALSAANHTGHPILVIALQGVAAWCSGGAANADWMHLRLRGRDVYVCYDSDVMVNPRVRGELEKLITYLRGRGAHARPIYLPAGPGGAKVGMDDFLAAGHTLADLLNLVEPELRPSATSVARPFAAYTVADLRALRTQAPGIDWLVDGYLARGHVTLLSATPKVGKTTLAFEISEAIVTGRDQVIGRRVNPGRVFHLDLEMGEALTLDWAERYGLAERDGFRLWSGARAQITDDLDAIRAQIEAARADMLVVDSFAKWTLDRVESEADNLGLIAQLQPLKRIAVELDVAVLVIHHHRKAPGTFSEIIRGGGGIFAEVDIAVNMYLGDKELGNPLRRLEAMGRFAEITPAELWITRRDGRYAPAEAAGDGARTGAGPRLTVKQRDSFRELALNGPIAYTAWEIASREAGVAERTFRSAIKSLETDTCLVARGVDGRYVLTEAGVRYAGDQGWGLSQRK